MCDGRPLGEDASKIPVVPIRREVHPVVGIEVRIDQAAERGERQIEAVDGMREVDRVAFRRFDGPQIVEFEKEAALFE